MDESMVVSRATLSRLRIINNQVISPDKVLEDNRFVRGAATVRDGLDVLLTRMIKRGIVLPNRASIIVIAEPES